MTIRLSALAALAAAVMALGMGAAQAQDSRVQQMTAQVQARFSAADSDHDGKLSKAEAKAGMPRVAARFDQIDTGHTGYVTLEQIVTYMSNMSKQ